MKWVNDFKSFFQQGHIRCSLYPTLWRSSVTAPDAKGAKALVRIVHPFHPLSGKQYVIVCERHNRHGDRVWYESDDGRVESIPRAWTDLASQDPFTVLSGGKACFRPLDLAALAEIIEQIRRNRDTEKPDKEANDV
jgi:hypothetical protein